MKHQYILKNKNIILRQIEYNDIEYLRQWRNDSKNTKYLRKIGYITYEQQQQWYKNYLENENEISFAIIENDSLNRIVGSCSLYNFKYSNQAEFGKILIGDEEAHGKKIGLNATNCVVDFALNELKLDKIVLECYEHNVPAQKTYLKAGFKPTGEYRDDGFDKAIYFEIVK